MMSSYRKRSLPELDVMDDMSRLLRTYPLLRLVEDAIVVAARLLASSRPLATASSVLASTGACSLTELTNSESAASVVAPLRTPLPCATSAAFVSATSAFLTSATSLASGTPLSASAASTCFSMASLNLRSIVNGFSAVVWVRFTREETNVAPPVLAVLDMSRPTSSRSMTLASLTFCISSGLPESAISSARTVN